MRRIKSTFAVCFERSETVRWCHNPQTGQRVRITTMSEPNGNGARFDLASLAAKAQPTKIRTATARAGADNPFLDAVRSSHEQDRNERDSGWREVEVPSNVLDELITSMRALSMWFGETGEKIGVHLRIEFLPDGAS